jgi:hypothetical protein
MDRVMLDSHYFPKHEARSTKHVSIVRTICFLTNNIKALILKCSKRLEFLSFEFLVCFGFRYSNFGFNLFSWFKIFMTISDLPRHREIGILHNRQVSDQRETPTSTRELSGLVILKIVRQ